MNEDDDPNGNSSNIKLDDFHGQLYSVGAILSGLMIADNSDFIPPESEPSLLNTSLIVAFLAYFGTLLIGRFIHTHKEFVGDVYQSIVSISGPFAPVSGEFNEYHIGWLLGIVFVILLLIELIVSTSVIALIYLFIILVAAVCEYLSEETPEASAFFRDLIIISVCTAISVRALIWLAPTLVEIHEQVGSLISLGVSLFVVIFITLLIEKIRSSKSLLMFHILVGLSLPVIITSLAVVLFLARNV